MTNLNDYNETILNVTIRNDIIQSTSIYNKKRVSAVTDTLFIFSVGGTSLYPQLTQQDKHIFFSVRTYFRHVVLAM